MLPLMQHASPGKVDVAHGQVVVEGEERPRLPVAFHAEVQGAERGLIERRRRECLLHSTISADSKQKSSRVAWAENGGEERAREVWRSSRVVVRDWWTTFRKGWGRISRRQSGCASCPSADLLPPILLQIETMLRASSRNEE